jgi:hypothetical protein
MNRIQELHQKAMQWAEQAVVARIKGQTGKVQGLLEKALAAEKQAALLCDIALEPTRSVLHRSAASLALQCNRPRDAEQLIAAGLAGNPLEEIANELRDLMEQAWFERGLTVMRNHEQKKVSITQPIAGPKRESALGSNGQYVSASGYLRYASAVKEKKEIRVVADNGAETRFIVPEGMMNDIVRPLWDNLVIAEGFKRGNAVYLEGIRESKD